MKTIKLQTPVAVDKAPFDIGYDDSVMLIGSCFTENMGKRMMDCGFSVNVNPFGILYNPMSLFLALSHCYTGQEIDLSWLVEHDGLWHSWHHHGSFSNPDKQQCIEACNASIRQAHDFFIRCKTLVVTFGSACCFSHQMGNNVSTIVGNCHKVPQKEFTKSLVTPQMFFDTYKSFIGDLLSNGVRMIFTVSPVRHQAYGAHGNQIGKAYALILVDQIISEFQEFAPQLSYFPAYEIMLDELRDYRFYADDLLHPSSLAEEIIWQRFQQNYMTMNTIQQCEQQEAINRFAAHRPLHPK